MKMLRTARRFQKALQGAGVRFDNNASSRLRSTSVRPRVNFKKEGP